MPYFEYPRHKADEVDEAFSLEAPTSRAALERCTTQAQPDDLTLLSASENVTYTTTLEVLSAICGSLLPVFLNLERLWLTHFNNMSASPPARSSPAYVDTELTLGRNLPHRGRADGLARLGGPVDHLQPGMQPRAVV